MTNKSYPGGRAVTRLTFAGVERGHQKSLSDLTPSELTEATRQAAAAADKPLGRAVAVFPDVYYDLVEEQNRRARLAQADAELEIARKNREMDKLNRDAAWDRLSEKNARVALGEVEGCSPDEIRQYFEGGS